MKQIRKSTIDNFIKNINECAESGLTRAAYCAAKQLYSTYFSVNMNKMIEGYKSGILSEEQFNNVVEAMSKLDSKYIGFHISRSANNILIQTPELPFEGSIESITTASTETLDTDDKSEVSYERGEDGKIIKYHIVVYIRDKRPFSTTLSREETEILFGLYTYYGGNVTARNVANEFPKYTLPEVKRLFRAFKLTKDTIWAPPHLVEELSVPELNEYRINLKERAAFKYADAKQERDYKNLINKLATKINNLEDRNAILKELITENIILDEYKIPQTYVCSSHSFILYLSDLHIGGYNEKYGYIPLESYDEKEIKRRLSKVLSFISTKNYDDIIVVNLGDSIDSFNKQTTRGGHEIPTILSNKEQSQLYLNIMLWFFNAIKKYCKNIKYYCIGESNHDGDWGWINNIALASKLEHLQISSYISSNPIDKFDVNNVSIVYLHGKDIKNQFKGFPLVLNEKTINWFNNYFITSKQNYKNKICVVKGDLHQPAFTNCNTFDYYSCPSLYGSSQYIVANFSKTEWGVMYMEIDNNNNIVSGLIRD